MPWTGIENEKTARIELFFASQELFCDFHKGVIFQNTVPDPVRTAVFVDVLVCTVFRPDRVVGTHQVFCDIDKTPAVLCAEILQKNIRGLDIRVVESAIVDISHDAGDRDHVDLESWR